MDVITGLDKSREYSGLLLPGVGNFDPAIRSIRDYSPTDFKDYVTQDMPVLGICLGMEMFFEKSEEGKEQGLDVMDGEVVLLPDTMKIPHMGWNNVRQAASHPLWRGIDDDSRFILCTVTTQTALSPQKLPELQHMDVRYFGCSEVEYLCGTISSREKAITKAFTLLQNFVRWDGGG